LVFLLSHPRFTDPWISNQIITLNTPIEWRSKLKKLQSAPWFNRRSQQRYNLQLENEGRPRLQDCKINKQLHELPFRNRLLKPHRQHTMMKRLMYKDTENNEFTCMIYCQQIIRSLQISPLEKLVHAASTISATIQFTFLRNWWLLGRPSKQTVSFATKHSSVKKTLQNSYCHSKQHTSYHGTVIWNTFKPGHKLFFFYFRALNKGTTLSRPHVWPLTV
jgi:hypothetical protein